MKRVVSVSLGSSKRNAKAQLSVLGQEIVLERIGTDGDMQGMAKLFRELDGHVDAFGLGGTDLHLVAGERRYSFREIRQLVTQNVKTTPVVDGGGLKHTLERDAVQQLEPVVHWQGRKTLMVSAVDRFGMAEALANAQADVLYGDLIFGLGVDVPLRSLGALRTAIALVAPVVTQLPFKWFYPTGEQQESSVRDWRSKHYQWAEVLAGDTHFIKRYAPERLDGKTMLTQTITENDVAAFKAAGLKRLIATTPKLDGRNFGNNVMEAFFVALAGKGRALTPEEYLAYIKDLDFKPEIYDLN